jgi:hypothetical protein
MLDEDAMHPGNGAHRTESETPFPSVSLAAQFRDVEQVGAFFQHVPRWDVDRLIVLPLDWSRGRDTEFWQGITPPLRHWRSFPFGSTAMPELAERTSPDEVRLQLDIMDAIYRECLEHRVEFVPSIVLPKFVLNDADNVRQMYPGLFRKDGEFRLDSTGYLPLLESILDEMRARYPHLAGFELRFSEGSSANIREYTLDDLERLEEWLPLWATFAESYGSQHGIDMIVFAHHYHASRGTRKRLHNLLNRHPTLWVLEDLTWPEEHVASPYLGYMDDAWVRQLAQSNYLCVNFLLDTEYMGQGRLPSVLPGWWQGGLRQCRELGVSGVNGRAMRWDRMDTLDSWNLLNVDLFCSLARNPDQDARELLKESVARRFGSEAAVEELTDALLESERLIRLQTMNGIDFTSHSAFPPPRHLHRHYYERALAMKAVNDLFAPAGTALHTETTDRLTADREWRHQQRTVARNPQDYLNEKAILVENVHRLNDEIERIAHSFGAQDRAFVTQSYALWLVHVRALQAFTELAVAHAEWVDKGCTNDGTLDEITAAGGRMDDLAAECSSRFGDAALFELAPRLRDMAQFARQPPTIT